MISSSISTSPRRCEKWRAAPAIAESEGRSLLGYLAGVGSRAARGRRSARTGASRRSKPSATSSSSTRTRCSPCQLFDLASDPDEDHNLLPDPASRDVVDEIMDTHVRPFLETAPLRPHRSPFAG